MKTLNFFIALLLIATASAISIGDQKIETVVALPGTTSATFITPVPGQALVWSSSGAAVSAVMSDQAATALALKADSSTVTALATSNSGKEPAIAAGTSGQYFCGDKTWQTLTIPTNTNQLTNGSSYLSSITSLIAAGSNISLSGSGTVASPYVITGTNSGGTVTSVTAGTGLSGGTITTSGTISLPNTGTAGTYGIVTTDAQGRVTSGKRQETYSGTTAVTTGVFTVTFTTPFSAAPNIQSSLINGADNQNLRVTNIATTGFTVLARTRTDIVGLVPTWANASGLAVDVLITEK